MNRLLAWRIAESFFSGLVQSCALVGGYAVTLAILLNLDQDPLLLQSTNDANSYLTVRLAAYVAHLAVIWLVDSAVLRPIEGPKNNLLRLATYAAFMAVGYFYTLIGAPIWRFLPIMLLLLLPMRIGQAVFARMADRPKSLRKASRLSAVLIVLSLIVALAGVATWRSIAGPLAIWVLCFLLIDLLFGRSGGGRPRLLALLCLSPPALTALLGWLLGPDSLSWWFFHATVLLGVVLAMQAIWILPRMNGANTLLFVLSIGALLSAEAVLRSSVWDNYARPQGVGGKMVGDTALGWLPHDFFKFQNSDSGVAEGLADRQIERGNKSLVLCLGGSSTQGGDNPEMVRWTTRLQQELQDRGIDNSVFNGGVGGFASFQFLILFKERLAGLRPDLVIVYAGNNDYEQNYTSSMTQREWFELRRLSTTGADGGRLAAMQRALSSCHLYNLSVRLSVLLRSRFKHGQSNSPDEFYRNLAELTDNVHSYGGRILFVSEATLTPTVEYREAMQQVARRYNEPYMDIKPLLLAKYRWEYLFQTYCHYNPQGHRIMAALLADFIVEQDLLSRSPQ